MYRNILSKLLIILAVLPLMLSTSLTQDAQPIFRIGILDDERGSISNGARLAVSEINANGGVVRADGTQFRLELIIQPTVEGNQLEEAVDNLDRSDVIAVLGPEDTNTVLSNLPLLQSLNVPVLTSAIGDTVLASDASGLLFRTRAAERLQGFALAEYLTNDLNVTQVITIQLDRNSTAGRVGFSVALSQINPNSVEQTLLFDENTELVDLVDEIIVSNAQAVVTYGPPALASQFFSLLREAGWIRTFAYSQADDPEFRDTVPLEFLRGTISTTTWPLGATDAVSDQFLNTFVRIFGKAPNAIEAASYDSINLLANAISQSDNLLSGLSNLRNIRGVQGVLNTDGLDSGETSNNVAVVELNTFGGSDLLVRYAGTERVIFNDTVDIVDAEPTLTPTPDGVFITIESNVQNVRSGPSIDYDVLGQLRQGETRQVIGATANFDWVVIEFRGQQGWLATYLLDVTGDRSTIPIISPPPTPTPPPATATPTAAPISDIVIVSASPTNVTVGTTTTINVTIQNIGSISAGPFAVAATFPPDSYFSAINVPGLAGGAQQIVSLALQANSATGNFSAAIVADLNNEVNEGAVGEANNSSFNFNYKVDRPLILINSTTLNTGASVDLEGNLTPQPDIQYTGAGLNTVGTCTATTNCIGLISPALDWNTSHYDALSAANGINTTFIANAALIPGATIGVFTAEGRRGVVRVDSINPGVSITLTYRIYQ
ncbi:MAG: ABC transporter substrate-binding protein [Aggregatilineales bacterium]